MDNMKCCMGDSSSSCSFVSVGLFGRTQCSSWAAQSPATQQAQGHQPYVRDLVRYMPFERYLGMKAILSSEGTDSLDQ